MKPVTIQNFLNHGNEKLTMLTAYDYSTAKAFDEAGIDALLVGDSLGMVILGYDTTHKVSMEEMTIFTGAVARGAKRALVVADMPFGSYHCSMEEAVSNATKLIKAGAQAVKIEGGADYIVEITQRLCELGIPVMAHLGFTPQYLHALGGYKIQGKTELQTTKMLEQAQKLEKAGAFAVVLEMVPAQAAKYITDNISIPTIGIGAGADCDGQILVSDDLLGKYGDFTPKFAKKYAELNLIIQNACESYIEDVKKGVFPDKAHSFSLSEEEFEKLYGAVSSFN